jgi:hypothetical protein
VLPLRLEDAEITMLGGVKDAMSSQSLYFLWSKFRRYRLSRIMIKAQSFHAASRKRNIYVENYFVKSNPVKRVETSLQKKTLLNEPDNDFKYYDIDRLPFGKFNGSLGKKLIRGSLTIRVKPVRRYDSNTVHDNPFMKGVSHFDE